MESDTYDLAAKAEGGAPVARMMGPMMQMLLEDRFKLKIHRETKEAPVYILTVAKGGAKLEPTKDGSCVPIDLEHLPKPGEPRPNFCGNQSMRRTGSSVTMTARGITMSMFTGMALPQVAGRPIIDKTGLAGEYDIQIDFAPDNLMPEPGGRGGAGDPGAPSADTPAPSIFAALQQLGLKLEAGKGPVEILVIDHVERPSEN
ncbi:Peptidase M56, BlaR1 (fragment) [Candidatus Sulfopaludibacter sp. SbA3]